MARWQPRVLVLWAPDFDEVVATSLVCGLRQAGMGVKLVGVQGRPVSGQHGLTLQPDLALGQVARLGSPIACLAIPCAAAYLPPLLADPRLGELWRRALADEACLVVPADWSNEWLPPAPAHRLLQYTKKATLFPALETIVEWIVRDVQLQSALPTT